jgi:flagellar protein FliL
MAEKTETEAPKKKGKGKLILLIVGALVLIGGGGAGGFFALKMMGGGAKAAESEHPGPKLVPKSEEKRASAAGEGGEGHGGEGGGSEAPKGIKPPAGEGGDQYATNYYQMDKEFTSNLKDSVHFVQVGLAVSTPYDDSVIEGLKTHEIAVRSAVLMALGTTTEEQVFTPEGKAALQRTLVKAINDVLKQKEGFGGISNVYFTNFIVQ